MTSSNAGGGPSKTPAVPTCIGAVGVSAYRNAASAVLIVCMLSLDSGIGSALNSIQSIGCLLTILRIAVAQLAFEHLPRRRARELPDEVDGAGDLVAGEPVACVFDQLVRRRRGSGGGH